MVSPPAQRQSRKRPVAPFSAHLDLPSPIKRARALSEDEEITFLVPATAPPARQPQQGAKRRPCPREETENIHHSPRTISSGSASSSTSKRSSTKRSRHPKRGAYKLRGRR